MDRVIEMRDVYEPFVNGEFVASEGDESLPVVDPSTGVRVASAASGTARDVDRAVENSRSAFDDWSDFTSRRRGRVLTEIAGIVREHADRLTAVVTTEVGKPRSQADAEVETVARLFEFYAGLTDKLRGDSIPLSDGYVDYTRREPYGVTGHIVPWNYPIGLMAQSVAPALATGNSAVVKPSEEAPASGLELAEIFHESDLPDGLVNVVPGRGPEAGAAISSHSGIDKLSFTGSVETGRTVGEAAMENVTPVSLELGGKNPNVIFPDADFENAVRNAVLAIFTTNSGQACDAGSRLLVHEELHERFVNALVERTRGLSIGPGKEDPDVGPMISHAHMETVTDYLEVGQKECGEPIVGGGTLDHDGFYVEPTIFDDVSSEARIAQEEIFGPVLSVIPFADEAEAIELANDVDYGLAAGVFTEDSGRAHRFAKEVRAGCVFINEWFAYGIETPFGGYKQSGFGRTNGLEAIDTYTQVKNVCAKVPEQ